MYVNGHELTTKEISGVHNAISRKLNDLVSISMPQFSVSWPYKICTMYTETNAACISAVNEATVHYVLLNLHV